MRIAIIITLAAFFAATLPATAQYNHANNDSLIKASVIRRGKYTEVLYTINGEPVTKSTIETRLMAYNPSALELQQYHTVRRQSLTGGLLCGGLAILALGGVIQSNQQGGPGAAFSKAPVYFSLSIAGLIGEAIFLGRKNEHFGKAIEAYNARF